VNEREGESSWKYEHQHHHNYFLTGASGKGNKQWECMSVYNCIHWVCVYIHN